MQGRQGAGRDRNESAASGTEPERGCRGSASSRNGGRGRRGTRRMQLHTAICQDWQCKARHTCLIEVETTVMEDFIFSRALVYERAVVRRLKLETQSRELPDGKGNLVVMIIAPVVQKVLEWMNKSIPLHSEEQEQLRGTQFYKFLAAFFYSHNSGCSLRKGVVTMHWKYGWAMTFYISLHEHTC